MRSLRKVAPQIGSLGQVDSEVNGVHFLEAISKGVCSHLGGLRNGMRRFRSFGQIQAERRNPLGTTE